MLVEKAETGSTNDDLRRLALEGAPQGTAVLARRQTSGRGRAGRHWSSPDGGLYLSVLLRPSMPLERWGLLPLACGAAVVATLREEGFPAALKWPNDVLLDGRKVAGVLVETRLGEERFAVVGIGANLGPAPEGVPEATGLAEHGRAREPRAFAERLVRAVLDWADRLERDEGGAVLADVRAACATLGREVEWEKGEGVAVDIDLDGALVVERQGVRERVLAGDVRVRQRL